MTGEFYVGDCLDVMRSMNECSVDLVIGSPWYPGKIKRYGLRSKESWPEWFARVLVEAGRITKGYAFFVVNGTYRRGVYDGAVEEAMYRARVAGAVLDRPCIWHKNAPPSRKDYFGNDWEYIVAVRHAARMPGLYFNWEAIAEPPRYSNGGRFRQRGADGKRRLGGEYPKSKLARPRDVFRVLVGGGHMGSKLAHSNEAPFPEKLVLPFVKAFVPPNGKVLDPFMGSGTTAAVAVQCGVSWVGIDVRQTQMELTLERVQEAQNKLQGASVG